MKNSVSKPRIYAFDNLKFLLIVLVVTGHCITTEVIDNDTLKSLFIFIYSFHMPLFLFISGLFQNRDSDTINKTKIVTYVLLGFVVKILVMLLDGILFEGEPKFSLLGGDGTFWYLFVLANHNVICHILRKANPKLVLSFSIALALMVGYDDSVGDLLYLSRTVVFFPFYYVGFCLKPKQVVNFCDRKSLKILSVVIIAIWLVVCVLCIDDVYILRKVFTGRHPYDNVAEECNALWRVTTTLISSLLSLSFISLSTCLNKKIPLVTYVGQNTLQVYCWHSIMIKNLRYFEVFETLEGLFGNLSWLLLILIGLLISLCLSIEEFNKPIQWITKSIVIE